MSPFPLFAPGVSTVTGGGAVGAAAEAAPATLREAGRAAARTAAATTRPGRRERQGRAGRVPRNNDLLCMGRLPSWEGNQRAHATISTGPGGTVPMIPRN